MLMQRALAETVIGPRRIFLTSDAVGGIWRYSLDLAAGLIARGTRVLLVTMGPRPSPAQIAEADRLEGCELLVTDLPLDWTAGSRSEITAAAIALARLALERGADTIQLHAPCFVAEANWPAPVIAVAHSCVGTWWQAVRGGDLPPDFAWRPELVGAGLRAADEVLAPTRSFAHALITAYRLDRTIGVLPNGTRPIPHCRSARRPRVLTAGRLWDEGKNIRVLDEAAGLLDTPVLAAGPTEGPNGAAIDCRNLWLLGTLDRAGLQRERERTAVFVSAARYEPFGLAVLEAAQSGCALVLSDIPTFRELWEDAALFVHPDDASAIAKALHALLDQPDRRTSMGEAARDRSRRFSLAAMSDATWSVHCGAMADTRMAAGT